MSKVPFNPARDVAIANQANREQVESEGGMCTSPGCRHWWTVASSRGPDTRGLCSAHSRAKDVLSAADQNLSDLARERVKASRAAMPKVLPPRDPKAWARRLKQKEALGYRLTPQQRHDWRAALHVDGFEDEPVEEGAPA
jgi:hypothetical protein